MSNLNIEIDFFCKFITKIIVINSLFVCWALDGNRAFGKENWVEVEQSPMEIDKKSKTPKIKFLNYKERRQKWNFRLSLLGAQSKLSDYSLSSTSSNNTLNSNGVGFEGLISVSYNLPVVSIGVDFGVYSQDYDSDVSLLQPKASLHLIMDDIFSNPYVAPFLKIGASKMEFKNPSGSDLESNNTNLAISFGGGAMFLLDWFQTSLAMDAFFDYGLDATYLVLEFETFSGIPAELQGLPEFSQTNFKFGLQLVF